MIAIIDLQGGLGNQLFQYCFAKYLESQNFKIFIYIGKGYSNKINSVSYNEQREVIFDPTLFGFKQLSSVAYFILEVFKKFKLFNKYLYEIVNEETYKSKSNFRFVTSFNGFWQNSYFLNENVDFFKKRIESLILDKSLKKSSALVQVRRGDFIKSDSQLNQEFYENSFNILKKNYLNFNFDVVTDDVNWVKQNNLLSKANLIYPPSDEKEKVKKLFFSMLDYDNYIIGNSTFSFWAALLSHNENSRKIIDKKFFERIELNKNPRFTNWIKV